MDFEKILKQIDTLLTPAPEGVAMDAEAFTKYAKEQVEKAQADTQAGKAELAKTRLTALKAEVERLSKFEYKAGELPMVKVFTDPAQYPTTETTIATPPASSTPGGPGWGATAKGIQDDLAKLTQLVEKLVQPAVEEPKPEPEAPATEAPVAKSEDKPAESSWAGWSADIAKGLEPSEPEWGYDPPSLRN